MENPDEIALDDSDEEKGGNPDEIDLDVDSDDEEPRDDVAESKPAEQTQPTTTSIPLESIDQVASLPETEAREKVHEVAGTDLEDVEHAKEAIVAEETMEEEGAGLETRFLALDKCGFGRDFIQVRLLSSQNTVSGTKATSQFMDIPTSGPSTGPPRLHFDPEWLTISRAFHPYLPLQHNATPPTPTQIQSAMSEARTYIQQNILDQPYDVQTLENGVTLQPLDVEQVQTFCYTAAPHNAPEAVQPNQWFTNMQTEAFAAFIGVENKVNPLPAGAAPQ